jgi:hypothetical protein
MRAILLLAFAACAHAEPARIHVFVALADNKSQGIAPVPEKIGNGDDAERNLYWGCSEALKPIFKASGDWKLVKTEPGSKAAIIERVTFTHKSGKWQVLADAYRGTSIRECTGDFFKALGGPDTVEQLPLVAYIGHDGLMEFTPPEDSIAKKGPGRGAIVLCCSSRDFFGPHLETVNAKPILTTTQLMYPGGFILRAALDGWMRGETNEQVRQRAAVAYARNQGISVKAAAGVFAAGK